MAQTWVVLYRWAGCTATPYLSDFWFTMKVILLSSKAAKFAESRSRQGTLPNVVRRLSLHWPRSDGEPCSRQDKIWRDLHNLHRTGGGSRKFPLQGWLSPCTIDKSARVQPLLLIFTSLEGLICLPAELQLREQLRMKTSWHSAGEIKINLIIPAKVKSQGKEIAYNLPDAG